MLPVLAVGPGLRADDSSQVRSAHLKGHPLSSAPTPKSRVLDRLRDKHRPVIVFGSKSDDAKFIKQQHSWAGPLPEAGVKDRDILVVTVLAQGESKEGGKVLPTDEVRELRDAFNVTDDAFAVVLVGRDGGEKVRWTEPVSAQEIFGKIDAMPMRQEEVKVKGGGKE